MEIPKHSGNGSTESPHPALERECEFLIQLPNEPVDGYELQYFSIDHNYVQSIRLKYHARGRWADVVRDGERGGADFIDEWQVFERDRFVARMQGWLTPSTITDANDFAKEADAVAALKKRFLDRAASLEEQARTYREKAEALNVPEREADTLARLS